MRVMIVDVDGLRIEVPMTTTIEELNKVYNELKSMDNFTSELKSIDNSALAL